MAVTTASFFRLTGATGTLWALGQMALARPKLAADPELRFFKLMGSGTGEGFDPWPNFSVFAILAVWPSVETAWARTRENPVFRSYRRRAVEDWTVFLEGTQCRGQWGGEAPFMGEASTPKPSRGGVPFREPEGGPMTVALTRATVKARYATKFWREVPDINTSIREQTHMLFKIGLGEVPLVHQCTFSIWDDVPAMEAFAYQGFHGGAIARVREGGWFKEELFARFHVLGADGQWEGRAPLPLTQAPVPHPVEAAAASSAVQPASV